MRFTLSPFAGLERNYGAKVVPDRDGPDLAFHLAQLFANRVYAFRAVRFSIGDQVISSTTQLSTDASNLAQVLHQLQVGNPAQWEKYVRLVRTVLSQIKAITVPPMESGGQVRVQLWNDDLANERSDLTVPLSESGTGVGQVLAMLYVVFTSKYPLTIVIDEPQSFLHPGAVRKLFDLLRHYQRHQHQYVITTHSPTAITATDPRALFLVDKDGEESVIEQMDVSANKEQARLLRIVGSSLSDVFGADSILWVEGPTEEECFPLILSEVTKRPLLGTKILAVVQTGDFESKHSDTIFEIYRRLSEGRGLLPPAVGFVFDREERTDEERKDLDRRSDGKVAFTKRRMYENYLLNSRAIASVVSEIEGFSISGDVTPEKVETWLEYNGENSKYFRGQGKVPRRSEGTWLSNVHGAKLLEDLFQNLSDTRVEYRKVEHGPQLTSWLLKNEPQDLEELAQLIDECLGPVETP